MPAQTSHRFAWSSRLRRAPIRMPARIPAALRRAILLSAFLRFAVLLIAAAGCRFAAAQPVTVRIPAAEFVVCTDTIRIGDIATIATPSTALASRLQQLELERFADAGPALISSEQLLWRLALAGVPAAGISLDGPRQILVRRSTPEETEAALCDWLAANLNGGGSAREGVLHVSLAAGQDRARLFQRWNHAAGMTRTLRAPDRIPDGPVSLIIETTDAQGQRGLISVLAEVRRGLTQPAFAAGTTVPDRLETGVRLVSAEMPGDLPGAACPPAALPSRNRGSRPTTPFAPPIVRAGSPVSIIYRNGGLAITVPNARALAPGAVGETIAVQNLSTRRQLLGRVLDADTVELVLPIDSR